MPTATYVNSLGRKITIVGVKHYASRQFWTNLSEKLSALDGETAIHFEKPLRDHLPWHLQLKSRIGTSIDRSQRRIWSAADCDFQFDALSMGAKWENHDAPVSRTLSAFRTGPLVIGAALSLLLSLNPRVARAFGRSQIRQMHAEAGKTHPVWIVVRASVILRERNAIAARAALRASGDVVMIWGHAHIPGIGQLLEVGGFRLTSVTWNRLFFA
jgi:hypothetical protein